jgi:hypothetical protein
MENNFSNSTDEDSKDTNSELTKMLKQEIVKLRYLLVDGIKKT